MTTLPVPIASLCFHLEEHGIATWSQGEGLLDDLHASGAGPASGSERAATRALLCAAPARALLEALPRAVVTTAAEQRLTQATAAGPVDLIPLGTRPLPAALGDFGLSPLAFAYRPARSQWCEAEGALSHWEAGRLEPCGAAGNPFRIAPRRFWLAARLLAEYGLVPGPELIDAARRALPDVLEDLPSGAPARRALQRILATAQPQTALAFLREVGVTAVIAPGADRASEARIAALPPLPAVRWAAWLRGAATARALVRLRMPHALARRIERLQQTHPIERTLESLREAGLRRILQRLGSDEIAALLAWRRLELAQAPATEETRRLSARIDEIEARLDEARAQQARSGSLHQLAIDGSDVMQALGRGPGRHVGRALAHLASIVEAAPERNTPDALIDAVREWAAQHPEP